jgi:hypothetical protein
MKVEEWKQDQHEVWISKVGWVMTFMPKSSPKTKNWTKNLKVSRIWEECGPYKHNMLPHNLELLKMQRCQNAYNF